MADLPEERRAEPLDAKHLGAIRAAVADGTSGQLDAVALIQHIDALRASIADLTAERDEGWKAAYVKGYEAAGSMIATLAKERDSAIEATDEARIDVRNALAARAADAPILQAAARLAQDVSVWKVAWFYGDDEAIQEAGAALSVACVEPLALLAALYPEEEAPPQVPTPETGLPCPFYAASGDDRSARTRCAVCGRPYEWHAARPEEEAGER